ncbi:MAG: AraC family transcriptional regulator ligand-binding domain-containing protein [Myxococcales bacterium]
MRVSSSFAQALVAETQRILGVVVASPLALERDLIGPEADEFLEVLVNQSRCGGLGLRLGARARLYTTHVVAHVMLVSASVRGALLSFARNVPLLTTGLAVKLAEEEECAELHLRVQSESNVATRFWTEFTFAFVERIRKDYLKVAPAAPTRLSFAYPPPSYASEYMDTFQSPLEFYAGKQALALERGMLDVALPHTDLELSATLGHAASRLRREARASKASGLLVSQILEQAEKLQSPSPSLASVGTHLGVAHGTLRRRLALEGFSYRRALDNARVDRAKQYLREGRAIAEIARSLGFSSNAAFYRAFKRWTGQTPGRFLRREQTH